AAGRLRAFTGFDRVSVHRFTQDWHLELLAESGGPPMPRGVAHVFPIDEEPTLWHPLFGLHWVRTIADVEATPVPVELPAGLAADPLALADVLARTPLASHERYLRDLGVRAATVLVLSNAGQAWGLVACHALGRPRRLSAPRRVALAAIARALSHRIAACEAAASRRHVDHIRERLATPFAALGSSEEFTPVLAR